MSVAELVAALPANLKERLDRLFDPIGIEGFLKDYHGKKYLHLPGKAESVADVMSWELLERLLNMAPIWSPASLQLVLDRNPVPTAEYCRPAILANGQEGLRPEPALVEGWITRGATLVLNDVDRLTFGLNEVSAALQALTGGRVQGNLYCSRRGRQAFAPHFDTHDVYALHCAGEKVWRLYEGQIEAPIAHRTFKFSPEEHQKHCGKLAEEIVMRPGDLLYMPRGRYHDALASQEGAIHIALGVTAPKAIDLLPLVMEAMISQGFFRADLPGPSARESLAAWQKQLSKGVGELVASPAFAEGLRTILDTYPYPRGTYNLDAVFTGGQRYRLNGQFKLTQQGAQWLLASDKGAVAVPGEIVDIVRHVVGQPQGASFSEKQVADLAAGKSLELVRDTLDKLRQMKVVTFA
jgi:hypothetical protein